MITESSTVTLVHLDCYLCRCRFGISLAHYERAKADSKVNMYCPNGHPQIFTDTKVARLERELAWEKQQRQNASERAEHFARSARVYRGKLTSVKRRIKHGICPCCKRTFSNVAAHMSSKHPTYTLEPDE